MGEPSEIRPLNSPSGSAEIWVYHRTTNASVQQIQVGTKSTPIIGPTGTVIGTINEPILRQQTDANDETIELLMFNGKFQQLKRSAQKSTTFN